MTTLVTFLLDRSSSMGAVRDGTIAAFNAYTEGLRGEEITLSLIQFDSVGIDMTYKNAPITDVRPLDHDSYQPRGGTPLIDAAVKAIKATEKRLAELDGDTKVVICIQTDGQENCSAQHSWEELNQLIKEKLALDWQFNFMGVGLDAYNQARRMGLNVDQTMSYAIDDQAATVEAFRASSANTRLYSSGKSRSTHYSTAQKKASGDKWEESFKKTAAPAEPRTTIDDIEL